MWLQILGGQGGRGVGGRVCEVDQSQTEKGLPCYNEKEKNLVLNPPC